MKLKTNFTNFILLVNFISCWLSNVFLMWCAVYLPKNKNNFISFTLCLIFFEGESEGSELRWVLRNTINWIFPINLHKYCGSLKFQIYNQKFFSSCLLSAVKWISLWWSGLVCSCSRSRFLTFYKFPLEL